MGKNTSTTENKGTPVLKTPEEIQALKDKWVNDPSFELEKTEGFEANADELKQFSDAKLAEWDKQFEMEQLSQVIELFPTLQKGFDELPLDQKIEWMAKFKDEAEITPYPETEEGNAFKTKVNEWIAAQEQTIASELAQRTISEVKEVIEQDMRLFDNAFHKDKKSIIAEIRNTYSEIALILEGSEHKAFFDEALAWCNAKEVEIIAAEQLQAFNETLASNVSSLKMIDYFAAYALGSLIQAVGYGKHGCAYDTKQIANVSYDLAYEMLQAKTRRGL